MDVSLRNYYSGTSGLLLPVPNKAFYPADFKERSRLCYYASLMNSIEINSSFYKIPMAATVKKWAADVPDEFLFTFKLFREITHNKGLAFDPQVVARFMDVISHAETKKGCLLVQFPPSVTMAQYSQLQLLATILRDQDPSLSWKIAFEFRHPSLYNDQVYELLDRLQFGMVIHDKKPAHTPIFETEVDFTYLRFHGPSGDYRGTYPEDVLYDYAVYIQEWLMADRQVFVYFNNTMGGAYANMVQLRQILQSL
jgi:uncharacterized protein YecE (DUF72 family)